MTIAGEQSIKGDNVFKTCPICEENLFLVALEVNNKR